ncbi:MAG: hypothetical protein FWH11_05845 [Micrococcales bacterium]|nr:hypothetical protein [Micrococcales bacterium]
MTVTDAPGAQPDAQPSVRRDRLGVWRRLQGWWDPRRWSWWVQTIAVYTLSRLWLVVVFTQAAAHQPLNGWTTTVSPSYLDFVANQFDGQWYRGIAECGPPPNGSVPPGCGFGGLGYPDELPPDGPDGVKQNAWAFFPAFPLLVRTVTNLTGGTWTVTAPLVATVLGALAMLVVYRLVVDGARSAVAVRPGLPLATVAVVCVFPTAPVLQTAYTESLALLLIALSLWALVRRWYILAAPAVVALGFTRAVALPMAVVVVVHAAARWWTARRARDPAPAHDGDGASGCDAPARGPDDVPVRHWVQIGALFVVAVVSGFCWPWLTARQTGTPDAYLQTQEAWRATGAEPFAGWRIAQFWVGRLLAQLGIDPDGLDLRVLQTTTVVLIIAVLVLVVTLLVVPAGRRTGPELVAWSAGYLGYIAAVVELGSSLARFLLLAFPMAAVSVGLVTRPVWARRAWLALLLVVMAALQAVWVYEIWTYGINGDWPP